VISGIQPTPVGAPGRQADLRSSRADHQHPPTSRRPSDDSTGRRSARPANGSTAGRGLGLSSSAHRHDLGCGLSSILGGGVPATPSLAFTSATRPSRARGSLHRYCKLSEHNPPIAFRGMEPTRRALECKTTKVRTLHIAATAHPPAASGEVPTPGETRLPAQSEPSDEQVVPLSNRSQIALVLCRAAGAVLRPARTLSRQDRSHRPGPQENVRDDPSPGRADVRTKSAPPSPGFEHRWPARTRCHSVRGRVDTPESWLYL